MAYTMLYPPESTPARTLALITDALLLHTDRLDAGVIAVFNLLGVWPIIYAMHLLADGKGRRLPAWPFVAASFCVGAFALLPYLALREDDGKLRSERSGVIRWFDTRPLGIILLLSTGGLLAFGLLMGDLDRYATLFATEPLVHVMTLDFLVLSCVFPTILSGDLERRGLRNRRLFWLVSALPLLGPACYVAFRPPLRSARD